MCISPARAAWELSTTVLPTASIDYRGEGKVLPESYVNRYDGVQSPLYRVEARQAKNDAGYWSLSLWHTGVFGGGKFGEERVPDNTTGGTYQTNKLNVGFTNIFVTRRRPVGDSPLEFLFSFSVVRQIFKRKEFVVDGVDARPTGLDDVTEISAEGLGLGLAGRHGDKFYFRWQTQAHYYIQLFDAKTDASAGQIFQYEGGLGVRLPRGVEVEVGGLGQYWFTHGQGNRRLHVAGSDGAVISWNRQETRVGGAYVRINKYFD